MKKILSLILSLVLASFGLINPAQATSYPISPVVSATNFSQFTWPSGYAFYTCTTNYYVATTGNNANNGTSVGTPWQTINYGVGEIKTLTGGSAAGYCLNIAPGTYSEATNGGWTALGGSGTGTNGWFVIRCTTLDACHYDIPAGDAGPSKFYSNFQFNNSSYIWIDGIDMEGQNTITNSNDGGLVTASSGSTSHHITVTNCVASNHGAAGVGVNHVDYFVVIGNTIANNAWQTCYQTTGLNDYQAVASDANAGYHNVFGWNVVYGNFEQSTINSTNCSAQGVTTHTDGNGIITDDFRNTQNGSSYGVYNYKTLIVNNISFLNGGGGIHEFLSDNVTSINNALYSNYLDPLNTPASQGKAEFSVNCGSNDIFSNNIGYATPGYNSATAQNTVFSDQSYSSIPGCSSANTGNSYTNNLGYAGAGNATFYLIRTNVTSGSMNASNTLGADPQYVNAPANIFTLQGGSPALNAGSSTNGYPPSDMAGNNTSPTQISMGAYQIPQNLSQWKGKFYGVLN